MTTNKLCVLQALGYDVDADDYHRIVHGRLPYHLIKPDPQLRNILLAISQRKIVSRAVLWIQNFK